MNSTLYNICLTMGKSSTYYIFFVSLILEYAFCYASKEKERDREIIFYLKNWNNSTEIPVHIPIIISLFVLCILGEILTSQVCWNLHLVISRLILLAELGARFTIFQGYCLILLNLNYFPVEISCQVCSTVILWINKTQDSISL